MNKKIVALCLVVVMLAVAVISSTMAYFTDTDEAVNVMVMGNIAIDQNEQKRADNGSLIKFDDKGIMLFPGVYADGALDTETAGVNNIAFWSGVENSVDKIITVTNKGNAPAYVRTWLAFEVCDAVVHKNFTDDAKLTWLENDAGELAVENIGGQNYYIAVYEYPTALQAGETSEASLVEFVIDKMATQEQVAAIGSTYEILAFTQAVQVAGFETAGAKAALTEAFGDEHPWGDGAAIAETTEVATAAELFDALAQAASGIPMNITLADDIVIDADTALTVPAGAKITLDLADSTITGTNTSAAGALIVNEGTLTIKGDDSTEIKNTTENGGALIQNNGTLTLDGGNYIGAPMGATGYPAYAIISRGDITIEEGTKIITNRGALSMSNGSNAVINGGTLSTSDAADGRNMTLHTVYAYGYDSTLTINDGTFVNNHTSIGGASVICPAGATINIYGGNFSDAHDDSDYRNTGNFQNYMGYGAPVNVYGGTFNDTTVKKNLASGYSAIDNGDGTYTVGIVASSAADVADAIANGADEVYLTAGEYNLASAVSGKTVTIKGTTDTKIKTGNGNDSYVGLNGANVTFEGVTIVGQSSGQYNGFAHSGDMTFKNCTFEGTHTIYADSVFENCTFNLPKGCYIWTSWDSIDVVYDTCTFNTAGKALLIYGELKTADITVKGCTFNATAGDKAGAITNQNCAAIEIDNSGKGVGTNSACNFTLTTLGNNVSDNFSGEWRIKTIDTAGTITVNGTPYTTLALDGYTMTINDQKEVTVNK